MRMIAWIKGKVANCVTYIKKEREKAEPLYSHFYILKAGVAPILLIFLLSNICEFFLYLPENNLAWNDNHKMFIIAKHLEMQDSINLICIILRGTSWQLLSGQGSSRGQGSPNYGRRPDPIYVSFLCTSYYV